MLSRPVQLLITRNYALRYHFNKSGGWLFADHRASRPEISSCRCAFRCRVRVLLKPELLLHTGIRVAGIARLRLWTPVASYLLPWQHIRRNFRYGLNCIKEPSACHCGSHRKRHDLQGIHIFL